MRTDAICKRLLTAPFVCNVCELKSRSSCRFARHVYVANKAQESYEALLSEARNGIPLNPLNKESFYAMASIISDAVRREQSIYHAVNANKLPVSIATEHRQIKRGYYFNISD